MKMCLMQGVPRSVVQDGWWLSGGPPSPPPRGGGSHAADAGGARGAVLLGLLVLGDLMFWGVVPGLSLAVFLLALVGAALWMTWPRTTPRRRATAMAIAAIAVLPLVELVQGISVVLALAGVSVALVSLLNIAPAMWARAALRFWPLGMMQSGRDMAGPLRASRSLTRGATLEGLIMGWVLPLGLGGVFIALLAVANPVIDAAITALPRLGPETPLRIILWLVLAPICWTVVRLGAMVERLRAAPQKASPFIGPVRQNVLNAPAILRALVVFNALFAVQTVMDAVYLYGGVGLPDGISYAAYAQRGAYPLLVTALLAGGFAVASRPWAAASPLLRGMLVVFVVQNVLLVISSLVRLEMYVDIYGLTRLRMSAAIWMAVVATGLGLTVWQIWANRDTGWLLARCGLLGVATLYLCAFVSFDAVIARHNLTADVVPDPRYLCRLGEAATPVIAAHGAGLTCGMRHQFIAAPRDLREWGFRNFRARHTLARVPRGAPQ
ncbi:DUF4173 domain-containing protein [Sulfitobacter sp. S190]|uniref:DUF4153 domain-containing protein n=1 Tax=Sulfitobacter sp. S190 TaxID=2867022 RepID=UPI0021A51E68|nr:DUF4173 domain-containing protein [Sulfitobacter sp. S190]UWR22192.1 DUF4173 domain-containing protein [Sulfitobacter sp. S190]